jgi:hypothetical protein
MKCPGCGADCLDLERAKAVTRTYGNKANRFKVSAPCCGAALSVLCRLVVIAEVEVVKDPQEKHDDWGVKYADPIKKETHESVIEDAYRDHTGAL